MSSRESSTKRHLSSSIIPLQTPPSISALQQTDEQTRNHLLWFRTITLLLHLSLCNYFILSPSLLMSSFQLLLPDPDIKGLLSNWGYHRFVYRGTLSSFCFLCSCPIKYQQLTYLLIYLLSYAANVIRRKGVGLLNLLENSKCGKFF